MNKHLSVCVLALLFSTDLFFQNVAWREISGGFEMLSMGVDSFGHVSLLN